MIAAKIFHDKTEIMVNVNVRQKTLEMVYLSYFWIISTHNLNNKTFTKKEIICTSKTVIQRALITSLDSFVITTPLPDKSTPKDFEVSKAFLTFTE